MRARSSIPAVCLSAINKIVVSLIKRTPLDPAKATAADENPGNDRVSLNRLNHVGVGGDDTTTGILIEATAHLTCCPFHSHRRPQDGQLA